MEDNMERESGRWQILPAALGGLLPSCASEASPRRWAKVEYLMRFPLSLSLSLS